MKLNIQWGGVLTRGLQAWTKWSKTRDHASIVIFYLSRIAVNSYFFMLFLMEVRKI